MYNCIMYICITQLPNFNISFAQKAEMSNAAGSGGLQPVRPNETFCLVNFLHSSGSTDGSLHTGPIFQLLGNSGIVKIHQQ